MESLLYGIHSEARLIMERLFCCVLSGLKVSFMVICLMSHDSYNGLFFFFFPPESPEEEVLCPLYVSLPIRATAYGPCAGVYHQWHHWSFPKNERASGMSAFILFFYFVLFLPSTIPIEAEYALLSQQLLFSDAIFQSPESCLALSLLTL